MVVGNQCRISRIDQGLGSLKLVVVPRLRKTNVVTINVGKDQVCHLLGQ